MPNTTLLIVAAGNATRMSSYTLDNTIPKLLLNIHNQTILYKTLELYQTLVNQIVIICQSGHTNLLKERLDAIVEDFPMYKHIELVQYDNADGTYNTIRNSIKTLTHLTIDKCIITWSDVLPINRAQLLAVDNVFNDSANGNSLLIFTDVNRRHRFTCKIHNVPPSGPGSNTAAQELVIEHSPNLDGNIVGLYACKDIKQLTDMDYSQFNEDFISVIESERSITSNKTYISSAPVEVIDIGDEQKYQAFAKSSKHLTRYFNKIAFNAKSVTKTALNARGFTLIQQEAKFYRLIPKRARNLFPELLSATDQQLTISRLNIPTVHEHLLQYEHDRNALLTETISVYSSFLQSASILHENVQEQLFVDCPDSQKEYLMSVVTRHQEVRQLINSTKKHRIIMCNSRPTDDYGYIVARLVQYLSTVVNKRTFIHGDPNTSNTFYDKDNNIVKFIDPRGYFGSSKPSVIGESYGDMSYDYAKFLYGLTGYSKFNLDPNFTAHINDGELRFDSLDGQITLDELTDDNHLKILVGLIWLKLPAYIKNHPLKAICAHYHGLALLNKYLPRI